jgi:hypothetical protein
MQCKETFLLGNFFEVFYSDEGIYLFCSKECKDKWSTPANLEKRFNDLQQA